MASDRISISLASIMDEGGGGHFFRKFVFLRNFGNVLFFFFCFSCSSIFEVMDERRWSFFFRIMDCTSFGGGKFWRILEEIMIQDWSQFFVEINNFFLDNSIYFRVAHELLSL